MTLLADIRQNRIEIELDAPKINCHSVVGHSGAVNKVRRNVVERDQSGIDDGRVVGESLLHLPGLGLWAVAVVAGLLVYAIGRHEGRAGRMLEYAAASLVGAAGVAALVFALLRQRRRHLTVSRPLACYEIELFLSTGALDRIVSSWVGIGLPWGLAPIFRHYVERGEVAYDEWSHLAMGLRYQAGAMGVPSIINDRVDIALAVDADGVHVGEDDLPVEATRRLVGPAKFVGASAVPRVNPGRRL